MSPIQNAIQTNKERCWTCNRKVGLTGIQCKCNYVFCAIHRYSDKHDCTYDYKAEGRAKITKENPVITPEKLSKL